MTARVDQLSPALPMLVMGVIGAVLMSLPRLGRRLFCGGAA